MPSQRAGSKQSSSVMKSHRSQLHTRVQSIPDTPQLKRFKVASSDYHDYITPSSLQQKYSYTPMKEKLLRNYTSFSSSSSSTMPSSTSSFSTIFTPTSSSVASSSCFPGGVDSCTADQCDGVLCGGEFDKDLQFLSVDELCDFEDDWEEDFAVPQTVPDSDYCTILSPDMSRSSTSTPHSTSVSSPTPNSQQIIASPISGPNSLTSSFLFKTSMQPSAGQVLAPLQHLNSSPVDAHTVNALVSRGDGTTAKQPHRKRQVANTTER